MSIRLTSYKSDTCSFELPLHPQVGPPSNSITVVIGPNGTGKSKLLGSVARSYISETKNRRSRAKKSHFTFAAIDQKNGFPKQVLALSNLVTDSFPFIYKRDANYQYLGVRQSGNSVSTGSLEQATRENLLDNFDSLDRSRQMQATLDILGLDTEYRFRIGPPKSRNRSKEDRPGRIKEQIDRINKHRFIERTVEPSIRMMDEQELDRLASRLEELSVGTLSMEDSASKFAMSEIFQISLDHGIRVSDVAIIGNRAGLFAYDPVFRRGHLELTFNDLSTGEQLLLSTMARLVASIVPESLVLIDEPEVGLHPNWQADYLPLLRDTVPSNYGCHFIIATHSPFIVADASDLLIPGDEWGSFIPFSDPFYGRSIENILYRVFHAGISGNKEVQRDLRVLLEAMANVQEASLKTLRDTYRRLLQIAGPDTPELNSILTQADGFIRSRTL